MAEVHSTTDECSGKVCPGCGELKPLDAFGRRPERPSGLRSKCRQCERLREAEYRQRNPEKLREVRRRATESGKSAKYTAKYRENNRAVVRARERERRAENADARRAKDRERYHERRDEILARKANWREVNRDRLNAEPHLGALQISRKLVRKLGQVRRGSDLPQKEDWRIR